MRGKPEDIPQDVWDTAERCWTFVMDETHGAPDEIEQIARAILAERERCAKVAEGTAAAAKACEAENSETAIYHRIYADIATGIAADIRNGTQP